MKVSALTTILAVRGQTNDREMMNVFMVNGFRGWAVDGTPSPEPAEGRLFSQFANRCSWGCVESDNPSVSLATFFDKTLSDGIDPGIERWNKS